MLFLVDYKNKIILGWSPKCGCTHIKKIFLYLKHNKIIDEVHNMHDSLPYDIRNYITIIIIRNPYERLVSGFIDKYKIGGEYRHKWKFTRKHDNLTFDNFVNTLIRGRWNMIEQHHFTPQTTEEFDKNKLLKSKKLIIYDIKNIDYRYLEELYNTKIPETLIDFKGTHIRKVYDKDFNQPVYNLAIEDYYDYNVTLDKFYNIDIKNKVKMFYEKDFQFFKENGFDYDLIL